jgi:hypothetical protein
MPIPVWDGQFENLGTQAMDETHAGGHELTVMRNSTINQSLGMLEQTSLCTNRSTDALRLHPIPNSLKRPRREASTPLVNMKRGRKAGATSNRIQFQAAEHAKELQIRARTWSWSWSCVSSLDVNHDPSARACSTGSRRRLGSVGISYRHCRVTEPVFAPTAPIVTTRQIVRDQAWEQSDEPR